MKRTIIFVTAMVGTIIIYGQTTRKYELNYDEKDFTIDTINGKQMISSTHLPIKYGEKLDEPGLPNVILHVLVSPEETFNNVNIQVEDSIVYDNIMMLSNPDWGQDNYFNEDSVFFDKYDRTVYPTKQIQYSCSNVISGFKYLTFLLSPFTYDTHSARLCLNKKIKITLELNKTKGSAQKELPLSNAFCSLVRGIVINANEITSLYPIQQPVKNQQNGGIIDYLIITADSLESTLQVLANWKIRKGVRTRVVTVQHIDTLYNQVYNDGTPNRSLRVKNYIKDIRTQNNNLAYVLLAGDNRIIPSAKGYLQFNPGTSTIESYTSCDLFFACLEEDYLTMGNTGVWGRTIDNNDLTPDINVTRLPIGSVQEGQMMVNRIINYERATNMEMWKDTILMAGHLDDQTMTQYGRPFSKAEKRGEAIFSAIYWLGDCYRLYDTWTDHPSGLNYPLNASHLRERMEVGYPFIHIDCHGNPLSYELITDSFLIQDAMLFHNPSNSLIVTSACKTNDFYELYHPLCLGEAFMKNPCGGIIGYWGSSDLSWGTYYTDFGLGVADEYNIALYNSLFISSENHLGTAATSAKLSLWNGDPGYTSPYRWEHFALNMLGDPEMPVFIHKPNMYEHVQLAYSDGEVYFQMGQPRDYDYESHGFRVCVMSLGDNGESYYSVEYQSSDGFYVEVPEGGDYTICITRPGFRPYIINIYNKGFIQNDSIVDASYCFSDNLIIGRNVSNQKPYGPVEVKEGASLNVYSINGVTIKNSFEVKKGATLYINPLE